MVSLYNQAAQMLIDWSGEDVGRRTSPREVSKEIVDMVIHDIQEHGFPSLDLAAAHDTTQHE